MRLNLDNYLRHAKIVFLFFIFILFDYKRSYVNQLTVFMYTTIWISSPMSMYCSVIHAFIMITRSSLNHNDPPSDVFHCNLYTNDILLHSALLKRTVYNPFSSGSNCYSQTHRVPPSLDSFVFYFFLAYSKPVTVSPAPVQRPSVVLYLYLHALKTQCRTQTAPIMSRSHVARALLTRNDRDATLRKRDATYTNAL